MSGEIAVTLPAFEIGAYEAPEGSFRAQLLAELGRDRDLSEFSKINSAWSRLHTAEEQVLNTISKISKVLGITELFLRDDSGFGFRSYPHPNWEDLDFCQYIESARGQIFQMFDALVLQANTIFTQGSIPWLLQIVCNDVLTTDIIISVRDAEVERRFSGLSSRDFVRIHGAEALNDEVRKEYAIIEQQRSRIAQLQALLVAMDITREEYKLSARQIEIFEIYEHWAIEQLDKLEKSKIPPLRSDLLILQTLSLELNRLSRISELARSISDNTILKRDNWLKCVFDCKETRRANRLFKELKERQVDLQRAIGYLTHVVAVDYGLQSKLNHLLIRIPQGVKPRVLEATISDQLQTVNFKGYPILDSRGNFLAAIPIAVEGASLVVWPCIQAVVFDPVSGKLLCDEEGFPILSCNTIVTKESLAEIMAIAIHYPRRPVRPKGF